MTDSDSVFWKVLRKEPDERNIANVKELAAYADGALNLVRETFPDYTFHDPITIRHGV